MTLFAIFLACCVVSLFLCVAYLLKRVRRLEEKLGKVERDTWWSTARF